MAGRPGRNRAWNKLSIEDHVRRGTYRKDRHGPIPPVVAGPQDDPPWQPDPEDVADLGAAGRTFLAAILDEFLVDVIQGVLLLEAARTLDGLTAWRTQAATDPKAARLTVQYTKTFAALVAQVGIR